MDLFESIATVDSRSPIYSGKAEMLVTLMSSLHLASGESLFVGDTMEDADAAKAAGIEFAWMRHGYGFYPQDATRAMEYMFDNFFEFLPLIAKEQVHD